ncbi:MAG TPA: hypothetical protein VHU88_01600 [Sporichthyaceae bacterium]|jgi:hypothetical protein|nr:hypothetical protein [Sporichthyaceae bacterium]
MKRIAIPLVAVALAAVAVDPTPALAAGTEYTAGPSNGDASTYHQVDPGDGTIMIFQHNTRQPGTVHCTGDGPRATLANTQPAGAGTGTVTVAYTDAVMTEHPVIDVLVTGDNGRVLGHKAAFGPMYYDSGHVAVPLFAKPNAGEAVRTLIGLQLHAGCLPMPFVLGLPGSRFLEGARATFPSVTLS